MYSAVDLKLHCQPGHWAAGKNCRKIREMSVVVIGGGISGLVAAHRLASQGIKVNLVEKSSRLGGWIESKRMGSMNSLFESGPRTLRPTGLAGMETLHLVYLFYLVLMIMLVR